MILFVIVVILDVFSARRLVMIRARAASSSNAGRLHSGMQLISVLQKESTTAHSKYVDALKARKPSLVSRYAPVGERIFLAEVLPDPHELIADARAKEKAIFRGFQSYLRTITEDIGRYALAHDEFNGWLPEVSRTKEIKSCNGIPVSSVQTETAEEGFRN